jgi:hypothetical protein
MSTETKFVLFNMHRKQYVTKVFTHSHDLQNAMQWDSFAEACIALDIFSEAQAEMIEIRELRISYSIVG